MCAKNFKNLFIWELTGILRAIKVGEDLFVSIVQSVDIAYYIKIIKLLFYNHSKKKVEI